MNNPFNCLDSSAEHSLFAQLVGVERPVISELVKRGVLQPGGSYREWLLSYTRRQREMAAGRGGEQQFAVAAAKARESKLKGDLLEIQLAERGDLVVPADEMEKMVGAMIVAVRTELLAMSGKLRERIKREHAVAVPRATIDEYIHSSLGHLATLGDQAAGTLLARHESAMAAAAEGFDDAMGESLPNPIS